MRVNAVTKTAMELVLAGVLRELSFQRYIASQRGDRLIRAFGLSASTFSN